VNNVLVMNENTFEGDIVYIEEGGTWQQTDYTYPYSKPNRFYLKPTH
jgi:hypothetical protein